MRENRRLAAQNMPPEFTFKPTRIYYDEPPGNVIYEDALGSRGKAPIDARSQQRMDPIHWSRGKGIENMQRTAEGLVSHLTHTHAHSQTPRTIVRKHVNKHTVNTIIREPKSLRQPRVKGYRTPQQVAKGAKSKDFTPTMPVDVDKLNKITDPRRGFRRSSSNALMQHLAQHPQTVEALARKIERREEREMEERVRVGGAELTQAQLASMPAGYVKELIRRQQIRDAQQVKPRVMFDPRESKGQATHGQFSNLPQPGLVEVEPGKYMRPEQLGMQPDGAIGKLGSNAQPEHSALSNAAWAGGVVLAAVLGLGLFLGLR